MPSQEDLARKLNALLHENGRDKIAIEVINVYTAKHLDLSTGKVTKTFHSLLDDQVIGKICFSNDLTRLDKDVRFSDKSGTVTTSIQNDRLQLKNTVIYTQLVDAKDEKAAGQCIRASDGYREAVGRRKPKGKGDRRYLRFTDARILNTDWKDVDKGATAGKDVSIWKHLQEVCKSTPEQPRRDFAVYFEHDQIRLNRVNDVVSSTTSDKPSLRKVIDAVAASYLKEKLLKLGVVDIFTSGNCAYSEAEPHESGIDIRRGVSGKWTYSAAAETMLSIAPCKGHFFSPVLVSELLMRFFGASAAHGLKHDILERGANMLRGVQITLAVKEGFHKRISVITGLGESARSKPESLHGTKGDADLLSMRFPDLPCVDIGTPDKPFYFPAEYCLISPNQVFRGKLPLLLETTTAFDEQVREPKKPFTPKTGDPFERFSTDGFHFCFIALRDAESTGSACKVVRTEAWSSFMHEIGQRYNRKLQKVVERSKRTSYACNFAAGPESWLHQLGQATNRANKGPKTALIVSVPPGCSSTDVDAIKAQCDLQGIQCQVVSAREINKRYDPVLDENMVKYTGQIVRKIFARTLIPGDRDDDKAVFSSDVHRLQGRLVGMHISKVSDFFKCPPSRKLAFNMDQYYVVSTVSTSTAAKDKAVRTSHDVFEVSSNAAGSKDGGHTLPSMLESHIVDAFVRHLGEFLSLPIDNIAIYISGLPTSNESDLTSLRKAVDSKLPNKTTGKTSKVVAKKPTLALIAVSPERSVSIADDVVPLEVATRVSVDDRPPKSSFTVRDVTCPHNVQSDLRQDFGLHARALEKVFRRPHPNTDRPSIPFRVVYHHAESTPTGDRRACSYPCLSGAFSQTSFTLRRRQPSGLVCTCT